MVGTRNETLIKNELIRYIASLGLQVNTVTKARGNKGFFKEGRIDISKTLDDASQIKTIIHEFAHYINFKIDKSLKNLDAVLGDGSEALTEELLEVTGFVDSNSKCSNLSRERDVLKDEINALSEKIRKTNPEFSLSEDFKAFRKYARFTDLEYLEKYDKVKVHNLTSVKFYSLVNIKKDFPNLPQVFADYLNLKSKQRRRAKISKRINKLNKYYSEPCELFARFIEGLYLDSEKVKALAPNAFERFMDKYNKNYFFGLRELFSIVRIIL